MAFSRVDLCNLAFFRQRDPMRAAFVVKGCKHTAVCIGGKPVGLVEKDSCTLCYNAKEADGERSAEGPNVKAAVVLFVKSTSGETR